MKNLVCSHAWIDPRDPPIARSPYSPIIGPGRREMKIGVTYVCNNCGQSLTVPSPFVWRTSPPKAEAIAEYYPPDWPRCGCGLPVLDGHLTCGRLPCDESAARLSERVDGQAFGDG